MDRLDCLEQLAEPRVFAPSPPTEGSGDSSCPELGPFGQVAQMPDEVARMPDQPVKPDVEALDFSASSTEDLLGELLGGQDDDLVASLVSELEISSDFTTIEQAQPHQLISVETMAQAVPVVASSSVAQSTIIPLNQPSGPALQFQIATATFQFSLNQRVDLMALARVIPGVKFGGKTIAEVESLIASSRGFRNQASFRLDVGRGRSISVCLFSNGTVNLAGCKTDQDAIHGFTTLIHVLQTAAAGALGQPTALQPSTLEVLMRKADASIDAPLLLDAVAGVMRHHFAEVDYTPARYCAVKIRVPVAGLPKALCVMVFTTGKMQIAGRGNEQQLAQAAQLVAGVIVSSYEQVAGPATAAFLRTHQDKRPVEVSSTSLSRPTKRLCAAVV